MLCPTHAKLLEKTDSISIRFDWWSIRRCRGYEEWVVVLILYQQVVRKTLDNFLFTNLIVVQIQNNVKYFCSFIMAAFLILLSEIRFYKHQTVKLQQVTQIYRQKIFKKEFKLFSNELWKRCIRTKIINWTVEGTQLLLSPAVQN